MMLRPGAPSPPRLGAEGAGAQFECVVACRGRAHADGRHELARGRNEIDGGHGLVRVLKATIG